MIAPSILNSSTTQKQKIKSNKEEIIVNPGFCSIQIVFYVFFRGTTFSTKLDILSQSDTDTETLNLSCFYFYSLFDQYMTKKDNENVFILFG